MKKEIKIKILYTIFIMWCLGLIYAVFNIDTISETEINEMGWLTGGMSALYKNLKIELLRAYVISISAILLFYFSYKIKREELELVKFVTAFIILYLMLIAVAIFLVVPTSFSY